MVVVAAVVIPDWVALASPWDTPTSFSSLYSFLVSYRVPDNISTTHFPIIARTIILLS
jgi:hypothetical protein